jgi:hypothetical protein
MERILSLLLCAGLLGCATPYQNMGFRGGVAAEQITADVYRIKSRGNGYTAQSTVQDYALLKAAETAKSVGASHFQLISADDASKQSIVTTPGTASTSVVGNTAFTTYSPGSTEVVIKPGQDAYVRVLRLANGQSPPPGALSADEIIRYIGGRVQRSS